MIRVLASNSDFGVPLRVLASACETIITRFTFIAAKNGHDNIVELLISRNANVNIRTKLGYTALMGGMLIITLFRVKNKFEYFWNLLAVKNGHLNVVNVLLKNDASVNISTSDGYSPLHRGI